MFRKPQSLRHRILLSCAAALPLCLSVSGCGGGGGTVDVASIPPPPPPPTTAPPPNPGLLQTISGYSLTGTLDVQTSWLDSPATRNGDYGVIGRLTLTPASGGPTSYGTVVPGEFGFDVTQGGPDGFNYALNAAAGILPGGLTSIGPTSIESSWEINQNVAYQYDNPYASFVQGLGQRLTAFDEAADGTEKQLFSYDYTRGDTRTFTALSPTTQLQTTLLYEIGYSYASMGEWAWRVVDNSGAPIANGDSGELLFVNGDRTPASGIPLSGTATYDARTLALLGSGGAPGIPFELTADFGQRTISAAIDQGYQYNSIDPAGDPILGIHVSGSSPFSNDGSFDIPLAGTANYADTNQSVAPPSESVNGDMNGAFFGPHAEDVGGTFALGRPDGTLLMQDAFVGQQSHH